MTLFGPNSTDRGSRRLSTEPLHFPSRSQTHSWVCERCMASGIIQNGKVHRIAQRDVGYLSNPQVNALAACGRQYGRETGERQGHPRPLEGLKRKHGSQYQNGSARAGASHTPCTKPAMLSCQ